jgi:CHAT domain-containing protein
LKLFRLEASDGGEETLGWAKVKTTPQLQIKQYNPAAAVELSQIILSPILDILPDCDQIIFAPDGNLNLVPLQILPVCPSDRSFLMDKYTVTYLGVGRDIIHSQHQPTTIGDTPIIIADPDFDLGMANNNLPSSQNPAKQELLETLDIKLHIKTLPPAHGTRLLGASVAKKLKNARLYTGEKALATCLTNSKCPSILLIATHGLFIPDSRQSNPMMGSAVAFAGANTALLGGNLPKQAGNGFIFAQDIAGLDLRANELTVLSACDTARGDIKIGEGVFGLRRAFASSGTKILIMSLWEVPGRATALLMEQFFEHYQNGVAAVEALQNAQNYIRDITVEELRKSDLGVEIIKELLRVRELPTQIDGNETSKPLEHPFYWGAWICQGEITK